VGLIRDLPPDLEKAFAATFEEIGDADLILHLADASAENLGEQIVTVEETLEALGLSYIPTMLVLNKGDLVENSVLPNLEKRYGALTVSALKKKSLGELVEEVKKRLDSTQEPGGNIDAGTRRREVKKQNVERRIRSTAN
jgi:GTP-binding protein HflX